jgi:hypothetical protein
MALMYFIADAPSVQQAQRPGGKTNRNGAKKAGGPAPCSFLSRENDVTAATEKTT